MGYKYNILMRNFDDKAWTTFGTEYIFSAVINLLFAIIRYQIVNFEVRKKGD